MNAKDIAVELHETDGFTLYAIVDGYLVTRRYIGENIRAAKKQFIAQYAKGGRK